MNYRVIFLWLVALGLGLTLVHPAAAISPQEMHEAAWETNQEMKETREQFREEAKKGIFTELRQRFSSPPGFLKSVLVRRAVIINGKVTAKDGTSLTVSKDDKSYRVTTGRFNRCSTRFMRRFWGQADLAEIDVGDRVHVFGFWQDESQTTIQACLIRDLSIQKLPGVFVGKVLSLTSTGWEMDPVGDRPNQTVTVTSATKFVNRRNGLITKADIAVGHRVRVKGLWNRANNTITEV
ncbi:MAG: DUF5666 domain-containing protein, partial [Patescibacteria group bacterium]